MASSIINAVGNKNILSKKAIINLIIDFNFILIVYGLLMSGACGIALYWAKNSLTIILLSAGYISISSIASTTLIGSVVSLFPTSTR